jgi:hypothetical protein
VRVAVPGGGRLRISGRGLTSVTRTVRKAVTVSFSVHLAAAERAKLRRTGSVKVRLRIRYTPNGGHAQTIVTRAVGLRR